MHEVSLFCSCSLIKGEVVFPAVLLFASILHLFPFELLLLIDCGMKTQMFPLKQLTFSFINFTC